jgi:hypothetical protein
MGLHLGHRDDEVRIENGTRQPQFSEAAEISLQLHSRDFVAIEVDELDLPVRKMRFQACGLNYEFGVTLMARTLADNDPSRAQAKKTASGRSDNVPVRIYRTRQVFHQIWLKENPPASHVQTEQPQPVHEQRLNLFGVIGCVQYCYK